MVTKLTLEYDGAGFAGLGAPARPADGRRTELERALGRSCGGASGSRADRRRAHRRAACTRGAQVALATRAAGAAASLNALLPDDVAVLAREPARRRLRRAPRRAQSRTYCYRVLARRDAQRRSSAAARCGGRTALDRDALDACAAALLGTHDFTAFTPTETEHVRFERDVARRAVASATATCSSSGSRPTRSCAT